MFCTQCGFQLPDDAKFCARCGAPQKTSVPSPQPQPNQAAYNASTSSIPQQAAQSAGILSPAGVTQLKCPGCGAPLSPKLEETVITCDYCGASLFLGAEGWRSVSKHTMLPARVLDREQVLLKAKEVMNEGLLHRHRYEQSQLVEADFSIVPYWLIPSSASTTVTYLWGQTGGTAFQTQGGITIGQPGQPTYKTEVIANVYDYPVVAVRALNDCQPVEFRFALDQRAIFDSGKIGKGLKVLNGDVSEEEAKKKAKALVDKLQYMKAHEKHKFHTISNLQTSVETGDGELLHVPIWRLKFDNKGKEIRLVIDANSGGVISSSGL
ncbi:MAG: zinc ribbon domain-containing protein [Conexivisphaerales archaeon]